MQFPKLTQLQSRFAACLGASVTVLVIYFLLSSPRVAYAAELHNAGDDSIWDSGDHTWYGPLVAETEEELAIVGWSSAETTQNTVEDLPDAVQPTLLLDDCEDGQELDARENQKRADIVGATQYLTGNNEPVNLNIAALQTQNWTIQNISTWTAKNPAPAGLPSYFAGANTSSLYFHANGSTLVYVTINTCLQPLWNGTVPQNQSPPQLILSVSIPGQAKQSVTLEEGFANITVNASTALVVDVAAPSLPSNFSGGWNYELAASVDNYYHSADMDPTPPLYWVDSDSTSTLLVTANMTLADPSDPIYQTWMNTPNPFMVYGQNQEYINTLSGVRNSFCGLQNTQTDITSNKQDPGGLISKVQMGVINRSSKPQQQFYVTSLNGSSTYQAILAMAGNSTSSGIGVVGGGGRVWQARQFSTKSGMSSFRGT